MGAVIPTRARPRSAEGARGIIAMALSAGFDAASATCSQQSLAPVSSVARMQYGNDQSFKSRLQQYFFDNYQSSLSIRVFNLFIKVLSCVLYCVRVSQDSRLLPEHVLASYERRNYTSEDFQWEYFWWVDRSFSLWLTQTVVAAISIAETFVIFYISYKPKQPKHSKKTDKRRP
uniref:Bestrophin homolog n=1 Tax=Steinernema glaseri TaxID=37863 RepID=A0A1I7YNT9_9BILA